MIEIAIYNFQVLTPDFHVKDKLNSNENIFCIYTKLYRYKVYTFNNYILSFVLFVPE